MTTSLREDIAESLDTMAAQLLMDGEWLPRGRCLARGAETLRWVDEFEGVPSAEEIAEAEELQERLDEIGELVTDKKLTAAQLRKKIEAVLER